MSELDVSRKNRPDPDLDRQMADMAVPWFLRSRGRLFSLLFLGLAPLMGGLVYLVVSQVRHTLELQAANQNGAATRLTARVVEEHFDGLARLVGSYAARPLLIQGILDRNEDIMRAQLKDLVGVNPQVDRAFVADPAGVELADFPAAPGVIGQNFSYRDWYRGVSAGGKTYISSVYLRAAEPKVFSVAVATPVRVDDKTVGYVVAQHGLPTLTEWVKGNKPTPTSSVFLLDHHGFLAIEEGAVTEQPRAVGDDPAFQKLLGGKGGVILAVNPVTQLPSLNSHVTLPDSGWTVLVSQPLRAVYEPLSGMVQTIWLLALLFFAAILVLGFFWLNILRRYHFALHEQMQGVALTNSKMEQEIRQRKLFEEALRASENRTRLIVDHAYDAFVAMDHDGRVLEWNAEAEKVFGWTRQEAAGRQLSELIMPERFREIHEAGLKRYLETGSGPVLNRRLEVSALRRSGHEFPAEITVTPIDVGEMTLFASFVRDITERQKAEQALKDSEALYHSLVESLPLHVFRKDLQGRFTFANESFCHTLHRPLREIVGRTDTDFYPPELAKKYQEDDQKVLHEGETLEDIEEHETAGGRSLFVHVIKTPIVDANGQRVGLQGIFWDVTDRIQSEKALKATAAELSRSNTELQQFAYVASHDLQEPLRMVASYTQLLQRRYQDKLDADANEFIRYAVDGARRMQTLINDLLAYSRVGTRGKPFKKTDCEAVLQAALSNLQIAIRESGAEVTHDPLPTVMGDVTQLIQLFQNLVGNAIKFHGQDPPRVHIGVERIVEPTGEDCWKFSVRDNGIGIEPQFFDRIFAIFQRLHSRDEYPGTGIGLAVCKKIIERHGGRIWVESTQGQGTTFFFTIPAGQPPEPEASEPSAG